MIGWIGTFSLAVALSGAVASAGLCGSAALRGRAPARWVAVVPLLGAAATVATLEWALLTHDFAVRFVAENGSLSTPTYYTVTSLWAAHDGSMLLWVLILAGYLAVEGLRIRAVAPDVRAWALAVLSAATAFFCGLALFSGDVFDRVSPVPADGPGPTPLLQDHAAMGIHPPLLYLGLLGMAVPFSYAVAGLVTARTGSRWVAVLRSSTLTAWILLTAGIVMGAWWSYAVLGWGGYWAWDPVENASLLPWLTATALLHSCMVQRNRRALSMWNLTLAVTTFVLACLASFLTRSGLVTSVHSFAESGVGPVLLGFLAALVVGALVLALLRTAPTARGRPRAGVGAPLGRGTAITLENLLLVALATTVLIGTLFPIVAQVTTGAQLSVGPPYFNRAALPVALLLLVLMGIGPMLDWRVRSSSAALHALAPRVLPGIVVGALTVCVVLLAAPTGGMALATFGLAAYVVTTTLVDTALRLRSRGRGQERVTRHRLAGLVVHVGVVVAAVGIAASSSYTHVVDHSVSKGSVTTVAGRDFRLQSVSSSTTGAGRTVTARLLLTRPDGSVTVLRPQLRNFTARQMTVTSPAVVVGPFADVYVTLLSTDGGRTAELRLAVNAMVDWIWAGGAIAVLGGLTALWPRRRRTTVPASAHDAVPGTEPDPAREPVAVLMEQQ
ncbi:heme lyase CcmF/NrfE family subunit [Nocardioides terrisoli]|uniref:heme lyase CcmF/NrfE family subunit n=1 Tax=Nocardioides terrisoli TaxID=3388267 RepID=UPI00287B7B7A|nr:cytochrome c-type biogenesis CcmF C-terminal domain-containing protein [Nocardioides marmorisolisilvae]